MRTMRLCGHQGCLLRTTSRFCDPPVKASASPLTHAGAFSPQPRHKTSPCTLHRKHFHARRSAARSVTHSPSAFAVSAVHDHTVVRCLCVLAQSCYLGVWRPIYLPGGSTPRIGNLPRFVRAARSTCTCTSDYVRSLLSYRLLGATLSSRSS